MNTEEQDDIQEDSTSMEEKLDDLFEEDDHYKDNVVTPQLSIIGETLRDLNRSIMKGTVNMDDL